MAGIRGWSQVKPLIYNLLIAIIAGVLFGQPASGEIISGLYAQAYGNPDRQPIVFLHGGPGYNSYSFEFSNAELLALRGYYVIVFDQRGSGRSDPAPVSSFTFANAIADVDIVIKHYRISLPIIVGHSYGGTLAIKWALQHPNSYKSIILADAPLDQPAVIQDILSNCRAYYEANGDTKDRGYIDQLRNLIFGVRRYTINFDLGGSVFWHASNCGLYSPHESNPAELGIWKSLLNRADSQLLTSTTLEPFQGLIDNDRWLTETLVPQAHSIRNLYGIYGEDDGLFTPERIKALRATIGFDKFRLVPGASHNIFIDQRDVFLKFIDDLNKSTPLMSRQN